MILHTRGDELWRILLPRNRNFRPVVKCGAQRRTYKAFVFSQLQQEKSWASRIFRTVREVRCGLRLSRSRGRTDRQSATGTLVRNAQDEPVV